MARTQYKRIYGGPRYVVRPRSTPPVRTLSDACEDAKRIARDAEAQAARESACIAAERQGERDTMINDSLVDEPIPTKIGRGGQFEFDLALLQITQAS